MKTILAIALLALGCSANAADVHWTNVVNQTAYAAGDTVHLWGTFTEQLYITHSGTAGNPITFLFEKDAKFSAPAFPTKGAIRVTLQNWITIDGGVNGLIENTANGTGLANHASSAGIYLNGVSNAIVKNLTITNIYVNGGSDPSCVDVEGQSTGDISMDYWSGNIRICSNRLSGARIGINNSFEQCRQGNIEIDHNFISDHCWGIAMGGTGTPNEMDGLRIHDNEITGWSNWQYPGGNHPPDLYHTDGIIVFASAPGHMYGDVYNNYIHGDLGAGSATAFIFVSVGYPLSPAAATLRIYNNLLVRTVDQGWALSLGVYTTNHWIANNTIIGAGNGLAVNAGGDKCIFLNNIFSGFRNAISTEYAILTNCVAASDRNVFYNITQWGTSPFYGTEGFYTPAAWNALGFDTHSLTSNPLLTGTYGVTETSPCIGAGTNLSATFTTDLAGKNRPGSAGWAIGAFEFGSAPPEPPPVVSGTNSAASFSNAVLRQYRSPGS